MSGPVILLVVAVTFVVAAALTLLYERRGIARELAGWDAVLRYAREGVVRGERAPFGAPRTGRPAVAVHIEGVVKERGTQGNVEETTYRRVFEQAVGAFRLQPSGGGPTVDVDLAGAELLRLPDAAPMMGITVFSPSTSMFAGGPRAVPERIGQFLVERGLPLPTVDSLFAPGLGVMVNERLLVPGGACWVAAVQDATYFDLGTVSGTRATFTRSHTPYWNALVVGVLVSIVAGMLVAFCSRFWS